MVAVLPHWKKGASRAEFGLTGKAPFGRGLTFQIHSPSGDVRSVKISPALRRSFPDYFLREHSFGGGKAEGKVRGACRPDRNRAKPKNHGNTPKNTTHISFLRRFFSKDGFQFILRSKTPYTAFYEPYRQNGPFSGQIRAACLQKLPVSGH